jgi:hypothetical protein
VAATLDVWISRVGNACQVDDGSWSVTLYDCQTNVFAWAGVDYADMAAPEGHWAGKVPPGTYVVAARRTDGGQPWQATEATETDHAIVVVGCEPVVCVRLYVRVAGGTGTIGTGTGTGTGTAGTATGTGTTSRGTGAGSTWAGTMETGANRVDDPVIIAKEVRAEGNTTALVEMYCSTPGAEIRYTTDLRDPDIASHRYIHPIRFAIPGLPVVVKARATAGGYADSRVVTRVIESG